jgi:phage shock protein A
MSIFSRLADIINSNLSAILDRAEDPEKMIRLMIQEMEDTLVEARTVAARVIADKKEGNRRLSRLSEAQAEWQRKAELALSKSRDDLAKGALIEKAKLAETGRVLEEELQLLDDALGKQEEDIAKLEAKLKEAKVKQKTVLTRHDSAASRLKVRQQVHERRMEDAFTRFAQMERRVDNLEGEVESFDLGRGKTLAEEISDLEAEQAVERELEELKSRLQGRGGAERT